MASEKNRVQCVVAYRRRRPRFDGRLAAMWAMGVRENAVKGMRRLSFATFLLIRNRLNFKVY